MRALLFLLLLPAAALADAGYFVDLGFAPVLVDPRGLYDESPDVSECREGRLNRAEERKAVTALNAIRALHQLPPVGWDGLTRGQSAKASLVIAASGELTHTPERSLRCWSADGRAGSETSNLYMGDFSGRVPSTEYLVAGWLKDTGVEGLGHRRWMLDPTLQTISFSRVDSEQTGRYGAAMRVSDLAAALPEGSPDFVAYPYERYPAFLWDRQAAWSVSVVDLPRTGETEGFYFFAQARVEVIDEATGRRADVSRVRADRRAFGLPNLLSWQVTDAATDRWYRVTVSNVKTRDGAPRSLSWRVYIDARPPARTVKHGGLTWEQKTAAKSRDKFTYGEARRYCASLDGRLPTLPELQTLVVKGRKFAVDTEVFPNISPYANYWTSTEWQPGHPLQQVVAFWDAGAVYQQPTDTPAGALCVVK